MVEYNKIIRLKSFSSRKFRQYMRKCKKCDGIFWTDKKMGTICSPCQVKNFNYRPKNGSF